LNNKVSLRELAKKYNISRQRLKRFLISKDINIDQDRVKLTNTKTFDRDFIDEVISLYKNGLNIKEISELKGLTIMITSRILHDEGVRISSRFKDGKRYDGKQPKKK
jgi:DNA invertase Pin-like site-specific DNA recombinase